jgi:DNA processing protein
VTNDLFLKEEKLYSFALSFCPNLGSQRLFLLKRYFGSIKKVWEASEQELLKTGLRSNFVKKLISVRQKVNLDSSFIRLRENGIECQILADKKYPENLKKIDNPPFTIFVKGFIKSQDRRAIAVVGSRKMTSYGQKITRRLVADLVKKKITIVSGLARGIDTVAHQTALRMGGRTIAVLAGGLDRIYPLENQKLAWAISQSHGALVSEYPPGFPLEKENFPARNRLIAGLSLGTLVIEGAIHSGSLITARFAAEQGREVFAVPGPIDSLNSQAPLSLIRQGAKPVQSAQDILEELNLLLSM